MYNEHAENCSQMCHRWRLAQSVECRREDEEWRGVAALAGGDIFIFCREIDFSLNIRR